MKNKLKKVREQIQPTVQILSFYIIKKIKKTDIMMVHIQNIYTQEKSINISISIFTS